jgi:methyl-accepting chemotaxis protein
MDIAVEKARVTSNLAKHLDGNFKEIYASFEKVSDMVHQVVSATEEQSATATEISVNLTTIAEDARESSVTVKDMAQSFDKFSANAKEFLKLLDGFKDRKMKIGVVKADYVLWFHRILDMLDAKEISFDPGELSPEKSRMGKWYCGEGACAFKSLGAFRDLEEPHKKLHELGIKAYEASKKGDSVSAKQCVTEAAKLIDGIIAILNRLESEA